MNDNLPSRDPLDFPSQFITVGPLPTLDIAQTFIASFREAIAAKAGPQPGMQLTLAIVSDHVAGETPRTVERPSDPSPAGTARYEVLIYPPVKADRDLLLSTVNKVMEKIKHMRNGPDRLLSKTATQWEPTHPPASVEPLVIRDKHIGNI